MRYDDAGGDYKAETIGAFHWTQKGKQLIWKGMNQMETGIPSELAVEIRSIYWSWVQMNDGAIWNV